MPTTTQCGGHSRLPRILQRSPDRAHWLWNGGWLSPSTHEAHSFRAAGQIAAGFCFHSRAARGAKRLVNRRALDGGRGGNDGGSVAGRRRGGDGVGSALVDGDAARESDGQCRQDDFEERVFHIGLCSAPGSAGGASAVVFLRNRATTNATSAAPCRARRPGSRSTGSRPGRSRKRLFSGVDR